jgi:hypothetical protein
MYEGYRLSHNLRPGFVELVVEEYSEGKRHRLFEMLFSKSRISGDQATALLKALVCRFSGRTGLGFEQIVSAFLNKRGKNPTSSDPFQITISYPEPGVKRQYCGTDTIAWIDEVIVPSKSRAVEG